MLGRLTMLLLAALLLAACGGDDADGSMTTADDASTGTGETGTSTTGAGEGDRAGAPAAEQAEGTVRVELRNVGAKDGGGLPVPAGITCTRSLPATCRETIECPVADDGGAAEQRVCAWLRSTGLALLTEEPEPGRVCTQVYGGPEVATVTGTVDGTDVDATFSREDGCAIARFDAVAPLWTGVVDPDLSLEPAGGDAATDCPVIVEPDAPVSSADQAPGAADEHCSGAAEPQPRIVDDPPEAFELERQR